MLRRRKPAASNLSELFVGDARVGRERQFIERLQAEPAERIVIVFEDRLEGLSLGQHRVPGRQFLRAAKREIELNLKWLLAADALIKAVEPYVVTSGTPAAFYSDEEGGDIQGFLISYVENFVRDAADKRFNPHVTIGVGTEKYLNEMLAEPFPSFTFSPAGAWVYQLGSFGTARKELKALTVAP
jgi:hypothetical protein